MDASAPWVGPCVGLGFMVGVRSSGFRSMVGFMGLRFSAAGFHITALWGWGVMASGFTAPGQQAEQVR